MSAKACTLLLARHGETDWNVIHRLQGQEDPPLNTMGVRQAAALAAALAHEPLKHIYSSDLRPQEPAAYAALASADAAAAPQGGESVAQLRCRCTAEVERLAAAHPCATLLLVAHGGVLQCLFERAAGRRPFGGGVPNGSLGRICVEGARWALLAWGKPVDPLATASGVTCEFCLGRSKAGQWHFCNGAVLYCAALSGAK
ncbi:hypothetical protein WJX81_002812 [Elliptochloris bilobata]|uniref:Phosphoglycerate mutase n=1 Tax=Elliptochloris bilobata TaxID=381761 RepID=A0AAW1QY86_9CHLO